MYAANRRTNNTLEEGARRRCRQIAASGEKDPAENLVTVVRRHRGNAQPDSGNVGPLVTSNEVGPPFHIKDAMPRSRNLYLLLCRVVHVWLSVALFLMLGLAGLGPVAIAADRARQQIDPQLQRPLDIPLERLERPLRTAPTPTKPINVNTASTEQLVALPGISASMAQQIVEGRPYHAKTDLTDAHILSDAAYDRIKNLIAVE